MNGADKGQYNIVLKDEYETFNHQVPVEDFIEQLEQGASFDEVCVLELGEAMESDTSKKLSRVLQDNTGNFQRRNSTIQFAVEGSFQRVKNGFELKYEGELYRLDRIFGAQLREKEEGWLVAPFQIS
jgi:hypothetical protein